MGNQVKKEPYGVGGWLALFCSVLLMAGLFSLGGALFAFKEKTEGGTIGGYIGIALVIFTMAVLTALCLHRRMAVRLAYAYLAVQALFWLLTALLGESVKYFAGSLAVCTAWVLYFYRSQRVRNTFYPESAPSAEQSASLYVPFPDVK